MQPAYVVILAVLLAALAAVLVALLMRRSASADTQAPELRQRVAELELLLAVGEQKLRQIPELEGALHARTVQLDAMRDEKAAAEKAQAASVEAIAGLKAAEADLRQRLAAAEEAASAARKIAADLSTQLATASQTIEQEGRLAGEKIALLTEAREGMKKEFKLLAEEVMKGHSETFGRQNREQIDTVLGPLREKLGEFQQGLQAAHVESAKERATLGEQIRSLTDQSSRMTTETLNLTRALKGRAQTQGAWGEMILSSILERSGLRKGEEYTVQESHATEDGRLVRTDVEVNLPGGQKIVIDSKVSLVAFEAHVNAETDDERATQLALHLGSLRTHIRTLSEKSYAATAGSRLDYVVMFVPIEGALAAALNADPALTGLAAERNVAIATPTTLMIALRTVANVWNVEKRHRNAEDIAARAGAIYDKFVGFAEDMTALGTRLNQARDSYDKAIGKLRTGKGNVVRQLEQLRALGASTNKTMPAGWADEAEVTLAADETARLAAE